MTVARFKRLKLGTGLSGTAVGSDVLELAVTETVAGDTLWDAKGDLAAGTGPNTAARLAVGSNGQTVVADSTQSTGLRWATPASPDPATDTKVWMPLVDSDGTVVLDSSGVIPTLVPLS